MHFFIRPPVIHSCNSLRQCFQGRFLLFAVALHVGPGPVDVAPDVDLASLPLSAPHSSLIPVGTYGVTYTRQLPSCTVPPSAIEQFEPSLSPSPSPSFLAKCTFMHKDQISPVPIVTLIPISKQGTLYNIMIHCVNHIQFGHN